MLLSIIAHAQVSRIERERMLNILKVVSHDVEKNFYDPNLKGLDWKALTDETRAKIEKANSNSEMIAAIYVLVDKLKDSHTQFLPPGRVNQQLFGFDAKPFGNQILIYRLKKGSAAEKAGLQLGDRIVSVNGFRTGRGSFDLMMLDMRVLRPVPSMRVVYTRDNGPEQTTEVVPKIKQGQMSLNLTNDLNIWALINEGDRSQRDYVATFDGDIGYVEVSSFETEENKVLSLLEHPKAVIVDLRGNPGGYIQTLLDFVGHFEPEQTTMGDTVRRNKTEPLTIKPKNPNEKGPVVVLIDSRSGSSAEMLARYLQFSRKAIVVGDHSSGRVNASNFFVEQIGADRVVPFGVQVSVGQIVLANKEQLEHNGVTPDIQCLPAPQDIRENRDPCLKVAVSAAHKELGMPEELSATQAAQVDRFVTQVLTARQQELDSIRD
jgi:carboxyl-terminal processing protease